VAALRERGERLSPIRRPDGLAGFRIDGPSPCCTLRGKRGERGKAHVSVGGWLRCKRKKCIAHSEDGVGGLPLRSWVQLLYPDVLLVLDAVPATPARPRVDVRAPETRETMTRAVADALARAAESARNRVPSVEVVPDGVGLGKSHAAAVAVADLARRKPDMTVVYSAADHALLVAVEDRLRELSPDVPVAHLYSPWHDGPMPADAPRCILPDVEYESVKRAVREGMPTWGICHQRCSRARACPVPGRDAAPRGVVLVPHATVPLLPATVRVVVVDEAPPSVAVESFAREDVATLRAPSGATWLDGYFDARHRLGRIALAALDLAATALRDDEDEDVRRFGRAYGAEAVARLMVEAAGSLDVLRDAVARYVTARDVYRWSPPPDASPAAWTSRARTGRRWPPRTMDSLLDALVVEAGRVLDPGREVDPEADVVHVVAHSDGAALEVRTRRSAIINPDRPRSFVLLDATAGVTEDELRASFRGYTLTMRPGAVDGAEDDEVVRRVWIRTGTASRREMVRGGRLRRKAVPLVVRLLREAVQRAPVAPGAPVRLGVLTFRPVARAIRRAWEAVRGVETPTDAEVEADARLVEELRRLPPESEVRVGWYGSSAARGSNDFADVNSLILVGDDVPQLVAAQADADALGLARDTVVAGRIQASAAHGIGRARAPWRTPDRPVVVVVAGRTLPDVWTARRVEVAPVAEGDGSAGRLPSAESEDARTVARAFLARWGFVAAVPLAADPRRPAEAEIGFSAGMPYRGSFLGHSRRNPDSGPGEAKAGPEPDARTWRHVVEAVARDDGLVEVRVPAGIGRPWTCYGRSEAAVLAGVEAWTAAHAAPETSSATTRPAEPVEVEAVQPPAVPAAVGTTWPDVPSYSFTAHLADADRFRLAAVRAAADVDRFRASAAQAAADVDRFRASAAQAAADADRFLAHALPHPVRTVEGTGGHSTWLDFGPPVAPPPSTPRCSRCGGTDLWRTVYVSGCRTCRPPPRGARLLDDRGVVVVDRSAAAGVRPDRVVAAILEAARLVDAGPGDVELVSAPATMGEREGRTGPSRPEVVERARGTAGAPRSSPCV
jgi:hypothetical protein